ncbi:DNA glycosylase AlkZ-like family protein [Pontibacter sp. G13]|uniref:winged helix-turn-helix domain-containing protein n=1 Tax=Pontibacter sp. G13 TaxID=3074898 RepID=UPI00288C5B0C|nr:crosslink repair DNA glycosylase YcaQ family protein [Pontibacter sp. G13]WNJ15921.1 crosslink repair DNA glycosylase YcaQ family protein [Pontibacter sp. G13]
MMEISKTEARKMAMSHQGLLSTKPFGSGKASVKRTVEHLGYIQLDTISVIERAHLHTLWTRNTHFQKNWLYEAINQKALFEYWSHAASILPMSEYRYSLPRKHRILSGEKHWFKKDINMMNEVLQIIRSEGPKMSRDFESGNSNGGSWYDWKPVKKALEQLFMEGRLMISHRNKFQKVYDLPERVLPPDIDTSFPTESEMAEYYILSHLRSHGLAQISEFCYLQGWWKKRVNQKIKELLEAEKLLEIKVEGIESTFITTTETVEAIQGKRARKQIHILSPFDNAIIQRKRLKSLFDFDYQIECYVPKPKRKFGYFTLPVLWGTEFIGRLDAKADRKSKEFNVWNIWQEPNTLWDDRMIQSFSSKLRDFSRFHGCDQIVIHQSDIPSLT